MMSKAAALLLLITAILISCKKLSLRFFGKRARGRIIAFGTIRGSARGFGAYPYVVRFCVNGEIYTANTLETTLGDLNGPFNERHLQREVTLFYQRSRPEYVSISEFKGLYIVSILFALLAVLAVCL